MRTPAAVAILISSATIAACGVATPASRAPSHGALRQELADSPQALASIHAQANRLLPGGTTAIKARLRQLRGYPVVINVWASWCGPCRAEFPLFQAAFVRFGRKVAFLGVNTLDSPSSARAFLARYPVSYPSYDDHDGAIARALGTSLGVPITFLYSASGKLDYLHAGAYPTLAQLERDIRYYAISGRHP